MLKSKKVIFKVAYKTSRSRGRNQSQSWSRSRSRNSDLQLCEAGAGAESISFGSGSSFTELQIRISTGQNISGTLACILKDTYENIFSFKSSTLLKKKTQIFLIYKEIQNGAVAKSYMTNGLLIYGEIFAHFLNPHILGNPSTYMTLQLLHSEFPYI